MKPSLSSMLQLSVGSLVLPENSHSNHAPSNLSMPNTLKLKFKNNKVINSNNLLVFTKYINLTLLILQLRFYN